MHLHFCPVLLSSESVEHHSDKKREARRKQLSYLEPVSEISGSTGERIPGTKCLLISATAGTANIFKLEETGPISLQSLN